MGVKKGCLGCFGAIVLLGGGSATYKYVIESREQSRVDQIQEERQSDLEAFASQYVPDVHRAIEELEIEIARRESSLTKFADELAKVGRVASQDKDFAKWGKKIDELRKLRLEMIERRNDVFIAHQKFNYDPDSAESKKMIENLMAPADREAEAILRDLESLRNDSQ